MSFVTTKLVFDLRIMKSTLTSLFLITCWLAITPIWSINPNRDVKVFLMKDGLLSDYVNCIAQDKFNMIWIGTEFGLNKYDGLQMTSFIFDPQNPHSISNNFIHDIYVDKINDPIWIATDAGLNKYDYKTGRFIKYFYKLNKSYNDIVKIIPKDRNSLWLASFRGGLLSFNIKKGEIQWNKEVFLHSIHPDGSMRVNSIIQDKERNIWIGTLGNGLYKLNVHQNKVSRYFTDNPSLLNVESFFIDPNNTLWIGTNKGLFKYNIDANLFVSDKRAAFLNSATIKSIKPSQNNQEVHICTDKGIYILKMSQLMSNSAIQFRFITENPESKGLSNSFITNILEDNSRNLWISTSSGGLNLILNKPSKFELVFETKKNPTIERKFLPITEDDKHRVLFGSNITQLYLSDTIQSHFSRTTLLLNELKKFGITDIQALCFSKSNVLWIGTPNNGLACYDFNTKEAYIYNSQNSNLPDNDIRAIKEDSKGNIWIGTNKGGLCSFYQKSQSFEIYNSTEKNQSFIGIRQIAEDNSGNWWIGTEDNGLKFVNPMTGQIRSFESNKKNEDYIPDNYMSAVFVDKKDRVWVGTRNGGLCYYDKSNKIFKSIPSRIGLPQSISHIEGDEKGNLWISSISSLYCYNTTTNTAVNYSKSDGIDGGLFLINSGIKTSKGRILFASTNGIIAFNPKNFFSSSETAFQTVITALQISNHTKDETENLWIRNLEQQKMVSLKHDQSSFTINFVSPNFEHANETKYAYYLEGEESTWNYMGNNNFASYRNLKPGKYIFRVKASNANNIWCKKVTELEIIIEPPLWETWPMKVIYLILLSLAGWAMWKYASRRIARINNQKIKEIEHRKNDEINNAKLQFFTNISHEFRTPITLILSPLSKLIEKEADPDKKYLLEVMRKNSNRLLKLVNEVLDFRKLDNETIQLHYEQTNIIEFINELTNSFSVFSKDKKIDILLVHPDSEISVSIDRMVVEKTILNLVSNAIKFSFEGNEVIVSVENDSTNQQVVIEVKDFGLGLNNENKTRIFEQFYQVKTDHQYTEPGSGIGLYLVKSLVELHHGTIRVESELNKGSRFIVKLPYNISSPALETDESHEFINNSDYNWDAEIETINESSFILENPRLAHGISPNTKYNLLIVEDDVDVRNYLVTEFRDEFHITEAENGLVALEISQEKSFDLVLSDIMMPKMNGIEFCNAFKKEIRTSHIPLILLTAKSSMENKIEGIEFGADDYIVKPFNVKYLRTKIYSLIRNREELRNSFGKSFSINMPVSEKQSPDDKLITKAIEFIKENITNTDLNGEMLADQLNISRVHLYRKLKALVDCSSSEFIRRVRLKHAITLLEANNLNVSEIAYDCGFSSPAYFSTCFSNFYGMSPKEYLHRKQNTDHKTDF